MERAKPKNRYYEATKSLMISGFVFRPNHEYRNIAATILHMIHRGKYDVDIQDELHWKHAIAYSGGTQSDQVYPKKELLKVMRIIHREKTFKV